MKIKVWKKNSNNEIEIISLPIEFTDLVITPEKVTEETVSSTLLSNLKKDVDYGFVNLDTPKLSRYTLLEVSKTDLSNVIAQKIETVLTLSFNKKDGSERILTGFTKGDKDAFGRYYFTEIVEEDERIRLVDPRELNWIHMVDEDVKSPHTEYIVLCVKGERPSH